ncbi:MAG: uroporphyrinogen decarboxylase family protein [bacterium]|nr:hypothetical protein [Candidatus Sumerlaeota bacterium]
MRKRIHEPLSREDVARAVEGRQPPRIPMVLARWWGVGLHDQYGGRLLELDERFPDDVGHLWLEPVCASRMNLSWRPPDTGSLENRPVLDEWSKLDEFIEKLPRPEHDDSIRDLPRLAEKAHHEGLYILMCWWCLFFEKPWNIRGMENLMVDYHENPDKVRLLHQALLDTYLAYLRWGLKELSFDGFFTSDDLGHQTQLMMSPAVFRSLIKPYYQPIGKLLKDNGKHFWLHSCGNNTEALDDLVDAGLSVFHPVQKHTMDEIAIARKYRGRLAFLAGFDVQQTLLHGTPDEVRQEARHLIDTFDWPEGGMCMAAGNGIVAGTPYVNIEAFLEETALYGKAHREQYR